MFDSVCTATFYMPNPSNSEPKFTDYLRTILRQFLDLRQSYDNWRIHRTLTTII